MQHKVFRELDDAQLEAFHRFIQDRRRTCDDARAWLQKIGLTISRAAVHRYIQSLSRPMNKRAYIPAELATLRAEITRRLPQVDGDGLAAIAALTRFYAQRRPQGVPVKIHDPIPFLSGNKKAGT